jgi:hypothetical protein
MGTKKLQFRMIGNEPGTVTHNSNPSTEQAEAEESEVQGQPGLLSETISKNQN